MKPRSLNWSDLAKLDEAELRAFAQNIDALASREGSEKKPETDAQLHAWIKEKIGINIPRIAVCVGHDPPFNFVADVFFHRVNSVIVVAGRGSGKTFLAALVQFLVCYFSEEEFETATVGAIEEQSKRAYDHLKYFIRKAGEAKVKESLLHKTFWKAGPVNIILTGSKSSVNGPHPLITHRDEVELMDEEVYEESLNMTRGKLLSGKYVEGIDIITSTRKTSTGLMQKLLDQVKEAEIKGTKSPYKIYVWCVVETMAPVANCRFSNPDLPEEEKCACNNVVKDEWEDGTVRTLESVCEGRFAKADGWLPLSEIINTTFTKLSKAMWDAQQECKRPYVEDITFPQFRRERHGVKDFIPDPNDGPMFTSIDFGGTNPHCVEWSQLLMYEVEASNIAGNPIRLPEGSLVIFDELYVAEIGNIKLADYIKYTELEWRGQVPGFNIMARFADPQAKAARVDFRDLGLPCTWPTVTRDHSIHINRLKDRIVDATFFVDIRCEMFHEEILSYNEDTPKRKQIDHAIDSVLYNSSNVYVLEQRGELGKQKPVLPHVQKVKHSGPPDPFSNDHIPIIKRTQKPGDVPDSEQWRRAFGQIS